MSRVKPGLSANCVVTGHVNGEIHFWRIPDLLPLHTIKTSHVDPVSALTVFDDNLRLVSGDLAGACYSHELPKF